MIHTTDVMPALSWLYGGTRPDVGRFRPSLTTVHTRHRGENDRKEQHGYALAATGLSLPHG
ncbi:hypothetical protein LWC05_07825 [Acetobacter sicerae]|uniref:Uncharacterized protein n=1 Tax=Acetobacter sicerae TaxID=85325 RepID=A0ABS8VUG3_9PROT|nr:hypothetical protein [Acetobacter sicerae]MCE0743801.1 hypothetical protein [Acetobacter sicerae]